MNRGNIPGYYFDEEKGKYFKILANHVAPPDAKYAKSNVKHERRQVKKRKMLERVEQNVKTQTVMRAKLLTDPLLGGSSLSRELGLSHGSLSAYRTQRESALINSLTQSHVPIEFPERIGETYLVDAHYIPESSRLIVAAAHPKFGLQALYRNDCQHDPATLRLSIGARSPIRTFEKGISSLFHTPELLVVSTDSSIIYVTDFESEEYNPGSSIDLSGGEYLWDCKFENSTQRIGLARSKFAEVWSVVRPSGPLCQLKTHDETFEALACEWLNPNTLAVGARYQGSRHDVLLWDHRSAGVTDRFHRKSRITGIHKPDSSGHNLIVSGNRVIALYDLRNTRRDQPVLSLNHLSGTTRLRMSTYNDILTAIDTRNDIQAYSLRTGKLMRSFPAASRKRDDLLQSPRWIDTPHGPYLQACAGNMIQQWSWC